MKYYSKKWIYINEIYIYNFSVITKISKFYKAIFFLVSTSSHYQKRYKIFNLWLKKILKIQCNYCFVIATKNNFNRLKMEYNNYNIIGVDIIDSYYNLTILTSYMYKFYIDYNLYSDFIIKNDEDIVPNLPILLLYINLYFDKLKISGFYYPEMKVSRNINSSVYIPESIYPLNNFPNFLAGGFVITNKHLLNSIYQELLKTNTILYREDMHMALIYKKLNINFQKLNKYYHRKIKRITTKMKFNDICWHGF